MLSIVSSMKYDYVFLVHFWSVCFILCILEQANRLAHDPNFPSIRMNKIGYSEIIVIYRSIRSIGITSTIFCRWIEFISFDSFLRKFKTDLSCTLVIIFWSSFVVLFLVIPTKLQFSQKKDDSSNSSIKFALTFRLFLITCLCWFFLLVWWDTRLNYQVYISCVSRSAFESRRHARNKHTIEMQIYHTVYTIPISEYIIWRCQLKCCYLMQTKRKNQFGADCFTFLRYNLAAKWLQWNPFVFLLHANLWLHLCELPPMNLGQKSICFQEVRSL